MSNLAELNRHLFAALDRLDPENMTPEQIAAAEAAAMAEIERSTREHDGVIQ